MKFINDDFKNLKEKQIGITIGNFDGLHIGHDYLLKNFTEKCKELSLTPVLLTFFPHPSIILCGKENFLLMDYEKKSKIIQEDYGIKVVQLEFSEELRSSTGKDFFADLIKHFNMIKLFYVGHDFGLGVNKSIDFKQAKSLLSNIEVLQENPFEYEQSLISSSLVRDELSRGEIELANRHLNRTYTLKGKVGHGNKIGRELGFPTANIEVDKTFKLPQIGVYFCKATVNNQSYKAVVNIGTRPTITDHKMIVVEAHLFDFNKNVYGEDIELAFYEFLRGEQKFSSRDDLITQIKKDFLKCKSLVYYKKFALVGKNIQHSQSPNLYKNLLNNSLLDYSLCDYAEESNIQNLYQLLQVYSYISITAPYKKYFYQNCDVIEIENPNIKSVNAIKLLKNKVVGTNTDYLASKKILNNYITDGIRKFRILGDGAMSDVIVSILEEFNQSFDVYSRKKKNLQAFELNDSNTLLINTCSRDYFLELCPSVLISVWDLNYNTSYAENLKQNKLIQYQDGLELLTLQAKYALSFWNLRTL